MKKKIEKKSFFKSKLFLFAILPVFALMLVSAGIMAYYGKVKTTVNVEQPIVFTVDGVVYTGQQASEEVDCDAGDICLGENPYRVTNNGNSDKEVTITPSGNIGNGVDVSYVGSELEVTQNSGQNEINEGLNHPYIKYVIDGDEVELTFVNPTNFFFKFDYRIDDEEGSEHQWSEIVINGGELQGELIGDEYNPIPVNANSNITVTVTASKLEVGLREGAENDWYLDWIVFELPEITSPLNVPAGSYVEFYPQFSVHPMATEGNYVVYTTVA